ncbi:MAG: hypothetical protein HYY49_12055 [Ignavibacteriales bacterium]|nr:hypothetical protein [Ignavibacteriales bacterium]
MNLSFVRNLIPFVFASFVVYVVSGCGTTQPTRHLDKYDSRPFADIATYIFSMDDVHKAAVLALQQKGYIVTVSDPVTGLVNGELESPDILAEEQKFEEQHEGPSAGTILLGILGIIFLFGIIAWLVSSTDDPSDSTSEHEKRERHREPYYSPPDKEKTASYRYVVSLTLSPYGMDSTEVVISAMRSKLENGGVVSSGRMENKYLNYSIFEGIQARIETKK